MLIPTVVLAINSPHYHDTEGIIAILLYEIVLKYLMLWIGFTILTSQYNYKRLYKAAYYALIVLTIFGIINTVIQSAPWISWLGNRNYDAEADLARERFAIKALFTNSFKYVLENYIKHKENNDWLFTSKKGNKPISRIQAYRISEKEHEYIFRKILFLDS